MVSSTVARLAELRDPRVRRAALDFDGKNLHALLHLLAAEVSDAPAVILGPGVDMINEDYILAAERFYTNRGVVALSIEGPGQGETRSEGVTVGLDNYQRAIETYAAYLAALPRSTRRGSGCSVSG